MAKPTAKGPNQRPKDGSHAGSQDDAADVLACMRRRACHGARNSAVNRRPTPTTATIENNRPQRVSSTSLLLMSLMVSNPTSGSRTAKVIAAVRQASLSAWTRSTLVRSVALSMSDLLDIGAAEQALRQEYQGDRQHRE